MKVIAFLALAGVALLFAQDPQNQPQQQPQDSPADAAPAQPKAKANGEQPADSAEAESRQHTRALSLETLREADAKMLVERQKIIERSRHLESLKKELENLDTALAARETSIQQKIDDLKKEDLTDSLPDAMIAQFESRDPAEAHKDFMELYRNNPKVATLLLKSMKKKRASALIDTVVRRGENVGIDLAAELYEAIGERKY